MKFRDVAIGARFQFEPSRDGFHRDGNTYQRISARRYRNVETGVDHAVGSINTAVRESSARVAMYEGARRQFRAYFRTMAMGGAWHVYLAPEGETLSGVVVAPDGDIPADSVIIARHVECGTEQTMVNAMACELDRMARA